jgi:hypothetical protein
LIVFTIIQAQQLTAETFKEYGVPLAYLLLTITLAGIIVRVLWSSNQKKDEKMEAMGKEFSATVRQMAAEHTQAFNNLAVEFRERRSRR